MVSEDTAVIGAVGPEACNRVPPKIEVMMGITAAPIMPANAPLPDIAPKAAPNEIAAKLTVKPAVTSARNLLPCMYVESFKMMKMFNSRKAVQSEPEKGSGRQG